MAIDIEKQLSEIEANNDVRILFAAESGSRALGFHSPCDMMVPADLRDMLHKRPATAHKGDFGHALLVAGSVGMAGAAVLAARGCMRSGVGKLSIRSAQENTPILQVSVPEAIMVRSGCEDLTPYSAVGIGPGIGKAEETERTLRRCLTNATLPMVIDADALNLMAGNGGLMPLVPQESILTPHEGELERMVGRCGTRDERIEKAKNLATRHGLHVVLKGHHTAICCPDGSVRLCHAGNPGMATAGSGDVLTGIITGLLAQGYSPRDAATLGVWLHATAGDAAAEALEQECMTASDIVRYLPQAFKLLKGYEK